MWFLYKIKTVRCGTKTITCLGPKIWSIIPDEIQESASLETFHQKIKLWKPDSCPCIYIYIYIYIYIHACVCVCVYICMHIYMQPFELLK